jgi:hypothetical protein
VEKNNTMTEKDKLNDSKLSPFRMTDGDVLLFNWISTASGYRNDPKVVLKSRKENCCVFGCNIPIGSSYLKFDIIGGVDGSMMGVGLCQVHHRKFMSELMGLEEEWDYCAIEIDDLCGFMKEIALNTGE